MGRNLKELGHTLELLRVAKRMTLEDVKIKTGLYVDQIQEIENGKKVEDEVINKILSLYDLELVGSPKRPVKEKTSIFSFFKRDRKEGMDGTSTSIEYDFNSDVDRVVNEIVQSEENYEDSEESVNPEFAEMTEAINDAKRMADANILAAFSPIITTSLPIPNDSPLVEENKRKLDTLKQFALNNHTWECWTDGGWLPDKHKGAWAYLLTCDGVEVIRSSSFLSTHNGSPASMECCAILHAVGKAMSLGIKNLIIRSDAQPFVTILNSEEPYQNDNSKLEQMVNKIKKSKKEFFSSLTFEWVKSHNLDKWNKIVDNAATKEFERRRLQRK